MHAGKISVIGLALSLSASARAADPPETEASASPAEASPSEEAAAEQTGPAPLIGVRVTREGITEKNIPRTEGLEERLQAELLEIYGTVDNPSEAGRREIAVHLTPGPYPDAGDYMVRVEAFVDGESIGDMSPRPCLSCTMQVMIDIGVLGAETFSPQFPEPAGAEAEPPPEDEPPPAETAPEDAPARRPRPMLYAGVGLSVLGVAGVGTGVGLIVAGKREESNEGQPYLRSVDYRPPGYVAAAVGGAALVAGVALIIVDVRRHKRHDDLALVPSLGPGFAGLSAVGRF